MPMIRLKDSGGAAHQLKRGCASQPRPADTTRRYRLAKSALLLLFSMLQELFAVGSAMISVYVSFVVRSIEACGRLVTLKVTRKAPLLYRPEPPLARGPCCVGRRADASSHLPSTVLPPPGHCLAWPSLRQYRLFAPTGFAVESSRTTPRRLLWYPA